MTNRLANVKGIDILYAVGGIGSPGTVAVAVSFDLLATAQSGGGTDTITLGGGGYNQGVATTQTLAQMIAARIRNGGTCTILGVAAVGIGRPGYQAGLPLYVQAAAVSGGNINSIGIYTAPTGGSAQSTTSANWDAPATIVVVCQMSVGQ